MFLSVAIIDLYVRLSIWDESKDGLNIQESDLRKWADAQGHTVREVWRDRGVSGYKQGVDRAAFKKATEALLGGEVEILACWKIDRLSRQGFGQVGLLMDRLAATGREIFFLVDGRSTANEQDRLGIVLASEQARTESKNTSIRVKAKNESLIVKGLPILGKRRFGYLPADPASGRIVNTVLDETEAEQVRLLFKRYLKGASIRTLATEQGWRPLRVRQTLANPAYAGTLTAGDIQYEAASHVARIISKQEFQEAQSRLKDRSTAYSGVAVPGGSVKHPLSGIMRCGVCGKTMSFRNGYLCLSDLSHPTVKKEIAEARVLKLVGLAFLGERQSGRLSRRAALFDLADIGKQIAALEAKEEDILSGLSAGLLMAQLLPHLLPLQEEKKALVAQREKAIAANVETRVRFEILQRFQTDLDSRDAYRANNRAAEAVLLGLPLDDLRDVLRLFDIYVWPGRGPGRIHLWPKDELTWEPGLALHDIRIDYTTPAREAVKVKASRS